ncbi:MAG: peptide deformylase [Actinomycetota bacterium]
MSIREVIRYPNHVLKSHAVKLEPGAEAERIAKDLLDTMRASPACVGLAAPQIGVGARAFVLDVTGHRKARSCSGLVVMINPEIIEHEGSDNAREGCMSLPDFTGNVRRATSILVRGLTPAGKPLQIEADAFEARALQHEIDHLNGLLFVDRVVSSTADIFPRKRYS